MLNERDKSILEHTIEYCDEIKDIVATFDDTLDTLINNKIYKHAISMCVLQIGELTTHLTAEFVKTNPLIPWKEIRAMRNIAVHNYKKFDIEILHGTIINRVPELRAYCQKVLDENPL